MIKDICKYFSLQGTQNIYFKSRAMLLHVIFSPFDIIQVALHCCITCVNLQLYWLQLVFILGKCGMD